MSDFQMAALIHAEHDITLEMLNRLEQRTGKKYKAQPIDPAQVEERKLLDDLIATCTNDTDRHFSFEENRLFPHILAQGGECMVNILTQEHAQIRPVATVLVDLSRDAIASGAFTPAQWLEFCRLSSDLIDIETFHIQKEEMGLIGALQVMFSPEQDAELAEDYKAISKPQS